MPVNILQINVDRTQRVVSEVREVAARSRIDLIAVQEPYIRGGKLAGFGVRTQKAYGGGQDATGVGAAIVLMNPQMGLVRIDGLSDKNCVVAEVIGREAGSFYLASMYCRYSERIDECLDRLRHIERALKGPQDSDMYGF